MSTIQPAHATKNVASLAYPLPPPLSHKTLHLAQDSTAATTTGSTLWLGAQVLTIYLYTLYTPIASHGKRALDLGAGTGLTSLALAALGWDVTSTDVAQLVSSTGILRRNIEDPRNGSTAGTAHVRELDWLAPPLDEQPYDLIVTADTIYSPPLVVPLLNTIRAYADAKTVVLVALEVRDEALIRGALETATEMGFVVKKVPRTKLRKALGVAKVEWAKEEWAGVEVWRLKWEGGDA